MPTATTTSDLSGLRDLPLSINRDGIDYDLRLSFQSGKIFITYENPVKWVKTTNEYIIKWWFTPENAENSIKELLKRINEGT